MFVAAVLCADHTGFVAWCRTHGYSVSGDGAEAPSGRWLAVRVTSPADLVGLDVDRVEYAVDFWRGERTATMALDEAARARLRRRHTADHGPAGPSPRG
jgi:hypothetical protein